MNFGFDKRFKSVIQIELFNEPEISVLGCERNR